MITGSRGNVPMSLPAILEERIVQVMHRPDYDRRYVQTLGKILKEIAPRAER